MRTLLLLAFLLLLLAKVSAEDWTGADEKAEELIKEIHPNYEPWFSPIWEPPSGEIETFLFSLQAAIGASIIGYILGYYRGKNAQDS